MNWERYSGDQVEEFVAALLLLRNPKGNRITPSQGDRGVDVQIRIESGGYEFYQIKRFSRSLAGSQKKQIKGSWRTFLEQTAPQYDVVSWNIVMPYDPTNQNLEWLNSFTSSSGIEVNWVGRAQLDAWAAENSQLVDYYFGDGKSRIEELLKQVLMLGQLPASSAVDSGDQKIDALMGKIVTIQELLNKMDPFYLYEFECRQGQLETLSHEVIRTSREGEVFASVFPLSDAGNNVILHVIARCAESCSLRPIGLTVAFKADPGTTEYRSLQRFQEFGLPPQNVDAIISGYDGPPGGPSDGDGLVSLLEFASDDDKLPPLEAKIIVPDSDFSASVKIMNVFSGVSLFERGQYLTFSDCGGVFKMTMLISSSGELSSLEVKRDVLTGRRPGDIVASIRFLAALEHGGTLTLQGRNEGALIVRLEVMATRDQKRIDGALLFKDYVESLVEIQRHVLVPIAVPSAESLSDDEVKEVIRCAHFLRGEQFVYTWDHFDLTVGDPDAFQQRMGDPGAEGMLLRRQCLMVKVGGLELDTGYILQTVYKTVRIAEESRCGVYAANDVVRLVPGEDDKAVMLAIKA